MLQCRWCGQKKWSECKNKQKAELKSQSRTQVLAPRRNKHQCSHRTCVKNSLYTVLVMGLITNNRLLWVPSLVQTSLTIRSDNRKMKSQIQETSTDQFFALLRESLLDVETTHGVFHLGADIQSTLSPHCSL